MPLTVPDYIEIYTAAGQLAAVLSPEADGLRDCVIDQRLNGECTLTFLLPMTSEKWSELTAECRIRAGGREFVILKSDAIDIERDDQGRVWGKAMAQESWLLLSRQYVTISNDPQIPDPPELAVIIVSGGSSLGGGYPVGSAGHALYALLQNSDWQLDTCDVTGTHDLETEKETLLANIQKVQEVWGGYLVWDSIGKKVSLRSETIWQNYTGFQIRYAKNLKNITRTVDFDLITKLYPFGEDELNIYDVNVLDSGTAQGGNTNTITLAASALGVHNCYVGATVILTGGTGSGQSRKITAYDGSTKVATVDSNWETIPDTTTTYEIKALFLLNFQYTDEILKGTYENQELATAQELKDKAAEVLDKLSRPRVHYKVNMVDLRTLPEYSHEDFALGDMVDVWDSGKFCYRLITYEEMQAAYNSTPDDPNWDPDCDLNNDNVIDIDDLSLLYARGGSINVFSTRYGGLVRARLRIIRHKYNVFQPWKCELEVGDPIEELKATLAQAQKASDFVKGALKPNAGIGNLLKGFVNTFATTINSANGKLVWDDSTLQAIEIDANGQETGKRVRITPGGVGISADGGQTYVTAMTGAGVLANTIICSALYALTTEDGYTKLTGSGLEVWDNQATPKKRLHAGQYQTGKFGLELRDKTGNVVILDEDGILQTWQEGRADNVDSAHPLVLNVYLPIETQEVKKALLRFRLQAFRAYETGAASGGGHTSSTDPSKIVTATKGNTLAVTGDGTYKEVDSLISSGMTVMTGALSGWIIDAGEHSHGGSTGSVSTHNHGIPSGTELAKAGGGSVTFIESNAHSHSISSAGSHTHSIYGHRHHITHEHEITIPSHSHQVYDHTHPLQFGIYEDTTPLNVTVKINGIDRTSVLGGPFNTDQSSLNITTFLTSGQWNQIELGSSRLGRLDATLFIQALMAV